MQEILRSKRLHYFVTRAKFCAMDIWIYMAAFLALVLVIAQLYFIVFNLAQLSAWDLHSSEI